MGNADDTTMEADQESLVSSLSDVFRAAGRPIAAEELACVLGTAFMTSHAPHADERRRWNVYGRHAFVAPAAALYGWELRALHPPDAAPAPPAPREFDLHFRDSYLPLIRASLEQGEPILAWMGWPAPDDAAWGVITAVEDNACVGHTPRGRAGMRGPAIQVYQVIQQDARRPSPTERAEAALKHAAAVLNNRVPATFRVVTGLAAIDAMEQELRAFSPCDDAEAAARGKRVARVLRAVTRGREAASVMFNEWLGETEPRVAETLANCLSLLGNTAGGLSPWVDETRIIHWMNTPSPWKSLEPVIELWRTSEAALAAAITPGHR